MLWDSGSNDQDGSDGDARSLHNNSLPSLITPVLVPSQSGSRINQQTVPVVVPDVEELKEQFQQQQYMLAQIKESIKENESQLSSKGKKVEAYANKLSQIRARTKTTDGKHTEIPPPPTVLSALESSKSPTKKPKENLTKEPNVSEKEKLLAAKAKLSPKGKIGELKKRLQESKIKFEERTDKEVSHTKRIESIIENLRLQLEERDVTIQELQKIVEQPVIPVIKFQSASKRSKAKLDGRVNISKSTQTTKIPQNDDSIEIITLQNKIYELEAIKLDLEERLKEKEAVIEARTQAVTLLSQDLSIKGKNTLECLEETRQEMRSMQNNFIVIENQLKKELLEKDDRLILNEKKLMDMEKLNAELREKIINTEKKFLELESQKKPLNESIVQVQNDDKVTELKRNIEILNKELDNSNKLMIKMKLEHKNKIKNLNKTIEKLKETSDDKAEIFRLENKVHEFELLRETWQNKIAELEEEKGNLLLSILDVDDFKVMEKNMREKINELETLIKQQSDDTEKHLQTISSLDKEKQDLFQSSQDQNILIENLYAKIQNLESESLLNEEKDAKIKELCAKLNNLEDEYRAKLEIVRSEHCKEMEMLESYYNIKLGSPDKRELEEYRISNELNNVQVEEQIEILIREKQQLLEKLKNLSGASAADSFTFEAVDHSELQCESELKKLLAASSDQSAVHVSGGIGKSESRELYLQKLTNEQQILINDLKNAVANEREKVAEYQKKIAALEESVKHLESVNKQQSQMESSDYNESLKNQKSNSNVKSKIKKIQMELSESKKTIKEQCEKLEELNAKLDEKEQIIKDYIEKIELFEKDDWGRENDWKSTRDDFENLQELQKKCLSLETSLIELNDDCERLRKENIEIVHLLSEEKVKRKKLMEKLQAKEENEKDNESVDDFVCAKSSSEAMPDGDDSLTDSNELNAERDLCCLEERVLQLVRSAEEMNEKLESVETCVQSNRMNVPDEILKLEETIRNLQEKLEWSNIVLTSKETEIFRLQNLLEDGSKVAEYLEKDLKETMEKLTEKSKKLGDTTDELRIRENQIEELTINFRKLQEDLNAENEKTASNECQLKILMSTVKEMESDATKKENELKEIQDILAEKNLDIHNLREWLEQVNNDLACNYKEHLENVEKCLRERELEYDKLVEEKKVLEERERNVASLNEDAANQRVELSSRIDILEKTLSEKENVIRDLNEKLNDLAARQETFEKEKDKLHEAEELKVKIKKLAGNLKKKVQNEKDLIQQIKDHEDFIAEKENILQKLQTDLLNVNEKWLTEKSEKEQFRNELADLLLLKSNSESENASLKERLKSIETEYGNRNRKSEYKIQQMETQLQKMYENSELMKLKHERDKEAIAKLEAELANLSLQHGNDAKCLAAEADRGKKENEALRKQVAEISGECEKLSQENSNLKGTLNELKGEAETLQKNLQKAVVDSSQYKAKTQEQLAVIENLEEELQQTRDAVKRSEDKLCLLEERRSSLENKNEEMLKRIEEESKNALLMGDMSNRIQSLMEVEENLKSSLKSVGHKNEKLEEKLAEVNGDKVALEETLKESKEKCKFLSGELEKLRNENGEKDAMLELLRDELEKSKCLQMQSKQKSAEIERLNRDIQMLESDLRENIENSKTVEKSFNTKIEELMSENAALSEKNILLTEEKEHRDDGNKQAKRKKSVTFRTDETDYIRDLKKKIREYSESLKRSNSEIERLKMQLMRETLKNEVAEVVHEAREKIESLKPSPGKISKSEVGVQSAGAHDEECGFDGERLSGDADGSDVGLTFDERRDQGNADFDSLMWDDGWGTDGHLEEHYLSTKEMNSDAAELRKDEYREKYEMAESEVKTVKAEKEKLEEELQSVQGKYAKAVKKVREQKAACDRLQSELSQLKMKAEFGGLDDAIVDELKCQISGYEQRERELLRSVENFRAEREGLLKRIDVLNAGNEKFAEMRERRDNDLEMWEIKNRELLREIAELRNRMRDREGGDSESGARDAATESGELRNRIEALEWEICELREMLEEKQELLELQNQSVPADVEKMAEEKRSLMNQVSELKELKEELGRKLADGERERSEAVGELKEQLAALANENEALQEILGKMKESKGNCQIEVESSNDSIDRESKAETKIFDYFKSTPANDIFSSVFAQSGGGGGGCEFAAAKEVPVAESVVERKIVKDLAEGSRSDGSLEKEVKQLKRDNESLTRQLTEAQSLVSGLEREKREMVETWEAERERALSRDSEDKSAAFEKASDLEQKLAARVEELNGMREKVKNLEGEVSARARELREATEGRQKLEKALEAKAEEVKSIWIRAQELGEALRAQAEEHRNCGRRMRELEEASDMKAGEINSLTEALADVQERMGAGERERNEISAAIGSLQQALDAKTEELNRLASRNRDLEKEIHLKNESIENAERINANLLSEQRSAAESSIPLRSEIEALNASLEGERSNCESLRRAIAEKEKVLLGLTEEVQRLGRELSEANAKLERTVHEYQRQRSLAEEYCDAKEKMEDIISGLQTELETVSLELELSRKEAEEIRRSNREVVADLESRINRLEREKSRREEELEEEVRQKAERCEALLSERERLQERHGEETAKLESASKAMEAIIDTLKSELRLKESDIFELSEALCREQKQFAEAGILLRERENEIADLKTALTGFQEEISSFRNFEKQVKELRMAQINQGAELSKVAAESDPDFTSWTEHELAELNTRLQSDLDTALYMLHQRDIRCDELTFELMQLLEERDTLQLRLSTAIRISEELRSQTCDEKVSFLPDTRQDNKDLMDQSNDRQRAKGSAVAEENLRELAQKISQLHSVGYIRDKTIQDETMQRHRDQMAFFGRISESDASIGRENQNSTAVSMNWIRTKSTPKVMHI